MNVLLGARATRDRVRAPRVRGRPYFETERSPSCALPLLDDRSFEFLATATNAINCAYLGPGIVRSPLLGRAARHVARKLFVATMTTRFPRTREFSRKWTE